MIRSVRQQRTTRGVGAFLMAACVTLLAAAGCGSDGTVEVDLPPTPRSIVPAVSGRIFAPRGQFVAADRWRWWPEQLRLVSPANALQGVSLAGGILNVVLWHVDFLDAKDGRIDNPLLINQARTNDDGLYEIVDSVTADLDYCRLMVAVGRNETLTRAFVVSHSTDLDAVSEAVVRVILDRLTKAPPVQLCDFTTAGLANILDKASNAAFSARGDSVAEINAAAFERVRVNRNVKQAIDDATGVPVAPE